MDQVLQHCLSPCFCRSEAKQSKASRTQEGLERYRAVLSCAMLSSGQQVVAATVTNRAGDNGDGASEAR